LQSRLRATLGNLLQAGVHGLLPGPHIPVRALARAMRFNACRESPGSPLLARSATSLRHTTAREAYFDMIIHGLHFCAPCNRA